MREKDGKVGENQVLLGLGSSGVWTLFRRKNAACDEFQKLCYSDITVLEYGYLISHDFIPNHVFSHLVALLCADISFYR